MRYDCDIRQKRVVEITIKNLILDLEYVFLKRLHLILEYTHTIEVAIDKLELQVKNSDFVLEICHLISVKKTEKKSVKVSYFILSTFSITTENL